MTYSLTIENNSGATQNVAVFQINSPSTGSSLVWLRQVISDQGNYSFTWDITWGLGWGSTSQPLNTGVMYQSESLIPVQPTQADGINEVNITYNNSSFMLDQKYYNQSLDSGVMRISTDQTFTVKESSNMSVAAYMYNYPILVSQGVPNSQYEFYTDTIYYLTVTNYLQGSVLPTLGLVQSGRSSGLLKLAVSQAIKFFWVSLVGQNFCRAALDSAANAMSTPTKVIFPAGQTQLTYKLTDTLDFVLSTD